MVVIPSDVWQYIIENYCRHEELVALEHVSKQLRNLVLQIDDNAASGDTTTASSSSTFTSSNENQQKLLVQQQIAKRT